MTTDLKHLCERLDSAINAFGVESINLDVATIKTLLAAAREVERLREAVKVASDALQYYRDRGGMSGRAVSALHAISLASLDGDQSK
jgi:hypothetical protein